MHKDNAAEKKNGSLKFISPKIPPINGPSTKPIPKAAPINPKFLNSDHTFTWLEYNADKDCYPYYLFDC